VSRYIDPKTYEGKTVRITELVAVDGVLEDYTFIDCHINGPAIIVMDRARPSRLTRNELGGTADRILWEITPDRGIVLGLVIARNCTFERCTFLNVGWAGNRNQLDEIRNSGV
jgi:hypothetical protein